MRSVSSLFIRGTVLTTALLLLCAAAPAETGSEVDEDGGVWNWDQGTYTAPDGRVVSIRSDDGPAETETLTVHNDDGSITITNNPVDIVQNEDGSITIESGQIMTPEIEKDDGMTGDEKWAFGMQKASILYGTYTPTYYFDGTGSLTDVEKVYYIGVYRSKVRMNGEDVIVDTANLIWVTDAPVNKVLASVSAKTNARIRLYPNENKGSYELARIEKGRVVRVLKTDNGGWTLVDYNGLRGYVKTSSLTFYANEPREYRNGWVSTRSGHIYGNSPVHVRNGIEAEEPQREEYNVGTPIAVIGDDGKWCHIEVEGHLCYILKEFMIYDDGQQIAASEDI